MKNEGKLLLAAFGRFLAYCLLAALPVFVLRQDLLGAGNTLGERSLVELTQTGFLLASSASFALLAWRCAQERRFALLASAFFMVMLVREQDAWLDVLIGHGAWKVLAVPIALAALAWAAADWRASVGALLRFVSSRAGTLMLLGLAVFASFRHDRPLDRRAWRWLCTHGQERGGRNHRTARLHLHPGRQRALPGTPVAGPAPATGRRVPALSDPDAGVAGRHQRSEWPVWS